MKLICLSWRNLILYEPHQRQTCSHIEGFWCFFSTYTTNIPSDDSIVSSFHINCDASWQLVHCGTVSFNFEKIVWSVA